MELDGSFNNIIFVYICYPLKLNQIQIFFSLRKISSFYLISRCRNLAERHSFHTRKSDEITVFFAVSFIRHCRTIRHFQPMKTGSCTLSFSETNRWNTPYYQQLPDVWIKIWLSVFQDFQETIRWFHKVRTVW